MRSTQWLMEMLMFTGLIASSPLVAQQYEVPLQPEDVQLKEFATLALTDVQFEERKPGEYRLKYSLPKDLTGSHLQHFDLLGHVDGKDPVLCN